MKRHLTAERIRTGCLFFTPSALSVAKWPHSALFPPRDLKKFQRAALEEILDGRVASSRNRRNQRGVKRKMSNFPLRRGYKRSRSEEHTSELQSFRHLVCRL